MKVCVCLRETMKVMHKVKHASSLPLGRARSYRRAKEWPQICVYQPQLYFEGLRHFLNPNRSQKLLLQVVDRAIALKKRNKPFQSLREWLGEAQKRSSVPLATSQVHSFVKMLLHICKVNQDPKLLYATLTFLKMHRIEIDDYHFNVLLNAMTSCGLYHSVKLNFRMMEKQGLDFRIGTLHNIVLDAAWRRDLEYAADVMHRMIQTMIEKDFPLVPLSMVEVMKACVGSGEKGQRLVEKVLEWHQAVSNLSKEDGISIFEWLHR